MNDEFSHENGDQLKNSETSDLNIMLSKRSILGLSLILYSTFRTVALRHIIAPIGLSILIFYWFYWSFDNLSQRDHEKKISNSVIMLLIVGCFYIIGILSIYILNLSKIDDILNLSKTGEINFSIGLAFVVAAPIIRKFYNNFFGLAIYIIIIIVWSIDTIYLYYTQSMTGINIGFIILFIHLLVLYFLLEGLRAIKAIQIENIPDINQDLVKSITIKFREKSSKELRDILSNYDFSYYSQEAFEASQKILEERGETEENFSKEELDSIHKNEQMERINGDLKEVEEKIAIEQLKLPKLKSKRKQSLIFVVVLFVLAVSIILFEKLYVFAIFFSILSLSILFLLDVSFGKKINRTIERITYFNSQIQNLKEEKRELSD